MRLLLITFLIRQVIGLSCFFSFSENFSWDRLGQFEAKGLDFEISSKVYSVRDTRLDGQLRSVSLVKRYV